MMKKKVLALILTMAMVFSFTVLTVSAEVVDQEETRGILDCEAREVLKKNTLDQNNNTSRIVISDLDEMLIFLNSEKCEPGVTYSFFIENPIAPKALCYMCGKPGLGLGTLVEQWSTITIGCPAIEMSMDHLSEWRTYQVERCTYCGYEAKIKQTGTNWTVYCFDGFLCTFYILIHKYSSNAKI